jgi:ribosomal protein L37E
MTTTENTTHVFETKCRRCGRIHEWYGGESENISYTDFRKAMMQKGGYATLMDCKKCGIETFQDILSIQTK